MNSTDQSPLLSVIIPIGPYETELQSLAAELLLLPDGSEILLVACPGAKHLAPSLPGWLSTRFVVRWISSATGRAEQLNAGAQAAQGRFLWFVHLDSRLNPWVIEQLLRAIRVHPDRLIYFQLDFSDRHGRPMWLNSAGANLRSNWLGVPFGDQALCLSAEQFQRLGGYPVDAVYGEDHLLVWRARRQRVRLLGVPAVVVTSARKYRRQGWLLLTLRYQWLWLRQALPQWLLLLSGK